MTGHQAAAPWRESVMGPPDPDEERTDTMGGPVPGGDVMRSPGPAGERPAPPANDKQE